jgi:hypothetical protein
LLPFHSDTYGPQVAEILARGEAGGGTRPMELFPKKCIDEEVRDLLLKADARQLFPGARDPQAALSGLFLYFSCLKESHDLLHTFGGADGAYWHGIMHRMEGDAFNANYWFQRLPSHPVYPLVHREAAELGYPSGREWDPFAFVAYCDQPADEELARRVQLAEWQLLFHYCAAPASAGMAAR